MVSGQCFSYSWQWSEGSQFEVSRNSFDKWVKLTATENSNIYQKSNISLPKTTQAKNVHSNFNQCNIVNFTTCKYTILTQTVYVVIFFLNTLISMLFSVIAPWPLKTPAPWPAESLRSCVRLVGCLVLGINFGIIQKMIRDSSFLFTESELELEKKPKTVISLRQRHCGVIYWSYKWCCWGCNNSLMSAFCL